MMIFFFVGGQNMRRDDINSECRNRAFLIVLFLFIYVINIRAQDEMDDLSIKMERDTLPAPRPLSVESFKINPEFSDSIYKANFKLVPSKVNIYDLPYSMTANYPNYKRLALNTGVLYGAGFVALGVLHSLPEDATAWNKKEIREIPPFKRWVRNVKKGPVWDKDDYIFNYVLHPYGGAAYYMGARSQGCNIFYSFLYSAGISTFFWEYGIEAFMEIPSIQDLIITPIAGTILGEGFYILKRHIVANDYKLLGSSILGNVVAYLIDPVNEVIGIFAGNPNRKKHNTADRSIAWIPWVSKNTTHGTSYGVAVSISF